MKNLKIKKYGLFSLVSSRYKIGAEFWNRRTRRMASKAARTEISIEFANAIVYVAGQLLTGLQAVKVQSIPGRISIAPDL